MDGCGMCRCHACPVSLVDMHAVCRVDPHAPSSASWPLPFPFSFTSKPSLHSCYALRSHLPLFNPAVHTIQLTARSSHIPCLPNTLPRSPVCSAGAALAVTVPMGDQMGTDSGAGEGAGDHTMWGVVYDHKNVTVYFRTETNQNLQRLRLV